MNLQNRKRFTDLENTRKYHNIVTQLYIPQYKIKSWKKKKTRPIIIGSITHHLFQHHYLKLHKLRERGGGSLSCKMMTSPPGQSGWELFPSFEPTDSSPLRERREELLPWPRPSLVFISPRTAGGLQGIPGCALQRWGTQEKMRPTSRGAVCSGLLSSSSLLAITQ